MLTRKIAVYDFSRLQLSPLKDGSFLNGPFFLTFPAPRIPEAETTLLSIPDALTLRMIQRSFGDNPPGSTILYGGGVQSEIDSLRGEGVFYFNETDEWILEAAFTLYNKLTQEKETFILRMPLSHPEMKGGEIGLYYDGTWLRFVKNGEVLNENKGHDCFMPSGPLFVHPSFADAAVAVADVVSLSYRTETEDNVGDFYMPHGFNAFAGDVMNFFHNGVYHVLYLLDRRHHCSCNGRGAHYIAHLTSKNLVDWEEQELAVPIAYPWQSFGTGTMVFHDGKYYMSYGLHSERYIWTPTHKLNNLRSDTESAIFSDADVCTEISYDDILINGKTPIGATYSVSTDGCHFSPSGNVYHTARNPSIYANETGGLTLWAGLGMDASHNGIWEAPYFGAPFVRSPEKHDDIAHPLIPYSTECPSLFDWNGYRYLIIGWSGYFRTRAPGSSEMIDAVAAGESVYDGLGVPMVCEYRNGRKLIAGWIRSIGWGSVILHRELIQESSGKLGMKWVPEMLPRTNPENLIGDVDLNISAADLPENESCLISLTIDPADANRLGIVFSTADGKACELQLDFVRRRVQITDASPDRLSEPIPALYEMAEQVAGKTIWDLKDIPQKGVNFCLPDIDGMDQKFTLRILLRRSRKMNSTVIDAEIAGKRTIVSGRNRFSPTSLRIRRDGEARITDASIHALSIAVQ